MKQQTISNTLFYLAFVVIAFVLLPISSIAQKKASTKKSSAKAATAQNPQTAQEQLPKAFSTPNPMLPYTAWTVCEQRLRDSLTRITGQATGSEVTVLAFQKEDSSKQMAFELAWIQVGGINLTKVHFKTMFSGALLETLAKPFREEQNYYCHELLPPMKRWSALQRFQQGTFPREITLKEALLNIPDLAYSNISLYEIYGVAWRFDALFTHKPERTKRIDSAESSCEHRDMIVKLTLKKQSIPAELLGSKDCQIWKEYYTTTLFN